VNQIWHEDIDTDESGDEEGDVSTGDKDKQHPVDEPIDEETKTPNEGDQTTRRTRKTQNQIKRKRTKSANPKGAKKARTMRINRVPRKKQRLLSLWNLTVKSKDKLFFISRHEPGQVKGEWHLIQVDQDDTNEKAAKQTGKYHIRYYIRQETDAKQKKIRECKHWPLLRELYTGGYLGPIIQIRPTKVETHLERNPTTIIWYQDTINLFDLKLVGPFNFQNNTNIVPHESWK
jgi:hypothetical protein